MPELPEAETIARDLAGRVQGQTLAGAQVPRPDILGPGLDPAGLDAGVRGRTLEQVTRRGKNVVLRLSDRARIVVNLGMTGRLLTSDAPRSAEMRHIAARFLLADGPAILFDDARRFGRIELHSENGWRCWEAGLGAEPLEDSFTAEALRRLTRGSRVPIRNWLLDQRHVAGVGNIYAAEALFRAGIRPLRRARTLRVREVERLRDALREVLADAIRARGTTLNDYRDGAGEEGSFGLQLRVYGREGEPCVTCGTPIVRRVSANRSTFYCPECQR